MMKYFLGTLFFLPVLWGAALAQPAAKPGCTDEFFISNPAYEPGKGPLAAVDGAHFNFHTVDGRYKPFAEFLRRDGYRVAGFKNPFTLQTLEKVDILVISNALPKDKLDFATWWKPPFKSAFTPDEIKALRAWVAEGGSLFLIVDHRPFPGAAKELCDAFGLRFHNGYAFPGHVEPGYMQVFDEATGLKDSAVTRGRNEKESVDRVAAFVGSVFKAPQNARPVIVFGKGSRSFSPRPGMDVLEAPSTPVEGWWQGAIMSVGRGRVAVFGEAAMFTCQQEPGQEAEAMGMCAPGAEQNRQLLLNIMHWLSRLEGMPD